MAKGKDTHTHTKIHTYTSKLRTIDEILSFLPKIVDEIISTAMFMTLLFTYLYICAFTNCGNQTLQSPHSGVHLAKSTQRFAFRGLYTTYVARIFSSLSLYRSMVFPPTIIIIEGAVFWNIMKTTSYCCYYGHECHHHQL